LAFNTKHWASWREFKECVVWMFGKNGMWQGLRDPYKQFYTEDFHPWRGGGAELIDKWQKNYYHPEQNKNSVEYLESHPA